MTGKTRLLDALPAMKQLQAVADPDQCLVQLAKIS